MSRRGTPAAAPSAAPLPSSPLNLFASLGSPAPVPRPVDPRAAVAIFTAVAQNDVTALSAAYTARPFDLNDRMFLTAGPGSYKIPDKRGSAALLHVAAAYGAVDVIKVRASVDLRSCCMNCLFKMFLSFILSAKRYAFTVCFLLLKLSRSLTRTALPENCVRISNYTPSPFTHTRTHDSGRYLVVLTHWLRTRTATHRWTWLLMRR